MCSSALHVAFSSPLLSLASRCRIAKTCYAGSSGIRPLRISDRAVRVGVIRGFAGESGASSEKEETSSTRDNGVNSGGGGGGGGAAVSDAAKGFGAGARGGGATEKKKKSQIIRRSAPPEPLLKSAPPEKPVSQFESAYVGVLALFFGLIFVEGMTLAASAFRRLLRAFFPVGRIFLPEEWDEFLVKSLYPAFTPTVGLFLVAAAGYGVFKYLGFGSSKE